MTIDGLGLSTRMINNLKAEGISQTGDLVRMTEVEVLRLPNVHRAGLMEVKDALERNGLSLASCRQRKAAPNVVLCSCGCGAEIYLPPRYATAACRQRASRARRNKEAEK